MKHEGKLINMTGAPYSAYHLINEICELPQDMTSMDYDEFTGGLEIEWVAELVRYGLEEYEPSKIDQVYTWSEFIYYFHVDV